MNTKIFGEFEVNKIKSILCNYAHNAKKLHTCWLKTVMR